MKNIPGDVSCETAGRGRPRRQASMLLHHSQPRIYKKKSATKKDISVESLGHPHHPSSPPEGVQFQLNTLPVIASCVGDGDGFTAFIDTADPREATYVPQEVHKALVARAQARCRRDYQRMDALASAIKDAGYLIVNGSNNQEILARKYRIRMRGIDAPELEMEYGMESRNELVNLIEGKCVMIHVYDMDQYERYIGDVYCDGVFIQEQMLKRGFAWYCEIYDKRCLFGQWEGEARAARQGLWLSDNPEKPWEWKRNHPRNAGKQDFLQKRPQKAQPILETQMDDESCEALSRMIKEEKNAEEKATGWEKELESVVAENRMQNDLLQESKEALQNEKEACNAEEKEARQRKKELESALAEKRMLNELLRKSKEALQNEKQACNAEEGKARQWKKELESALAEKRMLNELLRKSKEALQNEKEACNAEGGKARQWKKELESALAEKRMLNELLRKSNEALQNEKACNAEGGKARQWKKELESVVAENRMLKYLLWESEKEAEEKARQWKEELERMLWESEKESWEKARRWIEELESVEAENHMLKTVCWVGTSLLTVGIALLCSKWKTPPK